MYFDVICIFYLCVWCAAHRSVRGCVKRTVVVQRVYVRDFFHIVSMHPGETASHHTASVWEYSVATSKRPTKLALLVICCPPVLCIAYERPKTLCYVVFVLCCALRYCTRLAPMSISPLARAVCALRFPRVVKSSFICTVFDIEDCLYGSPARSPRGVADRTRIHRQLTPRLFCPVATHSLCLPSMLGSGPSPSRPD